MMKHLKLILFIAIALLHKYNYAQDIELFQQFNGRYDYTAIGNTLNPFENNLDDSFCFPLESSSATLNLSSDATIVAAYLYWAGSGEGDTTVNLNETSFIADDIYTVEYEDINFGTLSYFACYTDVTNFIISEGNINYELSGLDITEALTNNSGFCNNRTNFAGWSIYVVYQDDALPLNQINLYQGLEIINRNNQEKTIVIDNLNVIDNDGAKIGFLAWEGDNQLNFGESLSINGNILSNPPLNLSDNAFNGTNSFTNSNTFYNCDLDVYSIQDNINIGDTSAIIQMTTGDFDESGLFRADLIIINNIITVLNSQLPEATITLDDFQLNCGSRQINLDYTVFNVNSTESLPANTPIAFYADNLLIAQTETQNSIPIGDFETGNITVTIPDFLDDNFLLTLAVDDDGVGNSTVIEINEENNTFNQNITLIPLPEITILPQILSCDEGFNSTIFNLEDHFINEVETNQQTIYYPSLEDLLSNQNEIFIPTVYTNISSPQTVYVKVENSPCSDIYQFDILVENCPPYVPQGFSPNGDTYNDWFNIQGLYDIFEKHQLRIYNRYGTLVFEGDNSKKWDGKSNRGINNIGKLLPVGTYFYVLHLNDPNYQSLAGWVYMNY